MSQDTLLKRFEANSIGGIDHDSPVVIEFTEAKKSQGIALLKGDEGAGKSSTLNGIMLAMGASFDFDVKNLVNQKDGTIDIDFEFSHKGIDYKVVVAGTRLTLKRLYKDTGKWIPEGSPKETLRNIFGNLGVSPIFLRNIEGKKQIQWFKDTFGTDEEATKKELKFEKDLKIAMETRKELNRIVKSVQGWLNESDQYHDYERNQKKFAQPIDAKKEKEKVEQLQARKAEFDKAINGMQLLNQTKEVAEKQIERLERELADQKASLKTAEERIITGEKYIKANKFVVGEYEQANEAFLSMNKKIVEQTQWKEVLKKEKELDEAQQSAIQATATIDKLRSDLLKLTSTYLPEIKHAEGNLEIRTKAMSIDNESEDEGIYYRGKSLAQLSESEFTELWLKVWEKKESQFVFIENISSYGSGFIGTLNKLVKEGKIKVFASEMSRDKKDLTISFETAIK